MGKCMQIPKIICKLMIFATFLQLTGCYSSRLVSKTDLPNTGGNYVFHGEKSSYPIVKNAIISDSTISGKVDFSNAKISGEKYQIYVSHDSLIKVNNDIISVPLNGIMKITKEDIDHYRVNKKLYNYRDYTFKKGDPYNPSSTGFASLIIPGLGQMICGETGRGGLFLGGFTACLATTIAGLRSTAYAHEYEAAKGEEIALAGFVAALCIDFWSVGDAVKVAKVNNLALRYKHQAFYNLSIKPFMFVTENGLKQNIPLGLSLKITF
jgi:hypothetical protein